MANNPIPFAEARLTPQGASRWRSSHPWLYRAGVEVVEERTGEEPLAQVMDPEGRVLGHALLSRESQITLRRLTRNPEPVTPHDIRERLQRAVAYRKRIYPDRDAMRLVFGESDDLPGLIVDQYGKHLVIQTLSWGMASLQEMLVQQLVDICNPESMRTRNDPSVRKLEGLPRSVEQVFGETPDLVEYHEGDIAFEADLRKGPQTGAFLDQVANHLRVGQLAHGRVLDMFTYTGGFALAAARGADQVVAVDTSKPARKAAAEAARRNGIENVTFVDQNAFDFLKKEDKENSTYDLIVLDPPAFAKNKRELDAAMRGYKEINLRAMKLLNPGGILCTFSCSYHLTEPRLDEVLSKASAHAQKLFRMVERRRQSADHPVLLGFPEGLYLKGQILERVE